MEDDSTSVVTTTTSPKASGSPPFVIFPSAVEPVKSTRSKKPTTRSAAKKQKQQSTIPQVVLAPMQSRPATAADDTNPNIINLTPNYKTKLVPSGSFFGGLVPVQVKCEPEDEEEKEQTTEQKLEYLAENLSSFEEPIVTLEEITTADQEKLVDGASGACRDDTSRIIGNWCDGIVVPPDSTLSNTTDLSSTDHTNVDLVTTTEDDKSSEPSTTTELSELQKLQLQHMHYETEINDKLYQYYQGLEQMKQQKQQETEASQTPATPDVPQAPEVPEPPQVQQVPETPQAPEVPQVLASTSLIVPIDEEINEFVTNQLLPILLLPEVPNERYTFDAFYLIKMCQRIVLQDKAQPLYDAIHRLFIHYSTEINPNRISDVDSICYWLYTSYINPNGHFPLRRLYEYEMRKLRQ